jgi:branched-chain amino acid aminotransferase
MITNFPAWANGNFCQLEDLKISILDLGLIHCDATYEVISSKNRQVFMLDEHLDRFFESAAYWRLTPIVSRKEIVEIIQELCNKSNTDNLLIWIGLTRGIPSSGSPRDLSKAIPNMFIYVKPYFGFNQSNSATVCIAKNIRVPDFAINQKYKNFAWNDLTLAQWESTERGFDTAILLNYKGYITEGPGFNVCFIKDDTIITPLTNCLGGITLVATERICKELGYKFVRRDIDPEEIKDFDFAALASTAGNLIAVDRIEEIEFKNRTIFDKLTKAFEGKLNEWTIEY